METIYQHLNEIKLALTNLEKDIEKYCINSLASSLTMSNSTTPTTPTTPTSTTLPLRVSNGYWIFKKERYTEYKKKFPNMDSKGLLELVKRDWNSMNLEQRNSYKRQADEHTKSKMQRAASISSNNSAPLSFVEDFIEKTMDYYKIPKEKAIQVINNKWNTLTDQVKANYL